MSNSITNDPIDTIEFGYCLCGCGQKTNLAPYSSIRLGWIKNEPIRFIYGHNRGRPPKERFLEKIYKKEPGDCWIWTGVKSPKGYGQIGVGGKMQRAHRFAWEMTNGPIPDDLCVLHKCDNPSCVRASHLFLGTNKDNTDDMIQKGRSAKGHKNGHAKLCDQDILRIRELCASGMTQTSVAALYGVRQGAISRIINGERWSHVP